MTARTRRTLKPTSDRPKLRALLTGALSIQTKSDPLLVEVDGRNLDRMKRADDFFATVPEQFQPHRGEDLRAWFKRTHVRIAKAIEELDAAQERYNTQAEARAESPVTSQRAPIYGHPSLNFARQAVSWTGKLMNKLLAPLTAQDVAILMADLKLCRLMESPQHEDSIIDVGGYISTLGMVNEAEENDAQSTGVREGSLAEAHAIGLRMQFGKKE